jgi:predicted component of type VI protein secretion system
MTISYPYRHLGLRDLANSFSYACRSQLWALKELYERAMINRLHDRRGNLQDIIAVVRMVPVQYHSELSKLFHEIETFQEKERLRSNARP